MIGILAMLLTILDILLPISILIAAAGIGATFFFWKKKVALESETSEKKARISALITTLSIKDKEIAKLNTEITSLNQNVTNILNENEQLKLDNNKLEPYRLIINAEQRAIEILEAAKAELVAAGLEAGATRSNALQNAKNQIEHAELKLAEARNESDSIIAAARKRAEEIAGNAYKALEDATNYENTAKAMKNIIDGYGDQYIVPTYSLLDELAEEFSFAEAGIELKKARERTRQMVKSGRAAICDYVETIRKERAIKFVVDAFNGKVDSILSRTKNNNIGTLQQAIADAFSLVNYNGEAFRNARITHEFLNARLEELKWAVLTHELKECEKEEQRRIKEQLREEERSLREFEKAMRDAAKEEESLRRTMEKIQKEVSLATDAQKAVYEARLEELNEKLREAEERSKRALSMAQQTRAGHVYIISNIGSFGEEVFKIGMTRRLEPSDRVRELGDASVPFAFDIHAMIYSNDAPNLERTLHKTFLKSQMNKVNARKEFFRVSLTEIRDALQKLDVETHWTITAAAREYRESLAIERAISENPDTQYKWLQHQMNAVDEISESTEPDYEALA